MEIPPEFPVGFPIGESPRHADWKAAAIADELPGTGLLEVEVNKKGRRASLSLFFHCRRCGLVSPERLVHGRTGLSVVRVGGSQEQMTTSFKAKNCKILLGRTADVLPLC
jgi:hypothetical protein